MRRIPLALLTSLLLSFVPLWAMAHVGHGAPGLVLDLERVDRKGNTLTIELRLENAGEEPLLLQGFSTDLGEVIILLGDRVLDAGEVEKMTLSLVVKGEMPGIFTLIADFGEAGAGPVLVFTGA
jgi:hypothetical protein